jgi:O-antigen/teichoic acid export membrane protein
LSTATIRDARTVAAWQLVEYAGLAFYTVLVPRAMGPERFGRMAAVLAAVHLLLTASGLGAQAIFGRFLPAYQAEGRRDKMRALFTSQFVIRGLTAAALTAVLALLASRLLPGSSRATAALAGLALLSGAFSLTCFQLFYGLALMSRWRTRDGLYRVLLTVLLLAGAARSLEGAAAALALTELCFLCLGLWWARGYFSRDLSALSRAEVLGQTRFGALLFGANLLVTATWRGGELLLSGSHSPGAEIAYFSVAAAMAGAAGNLISQLSIVPGPSLALLRERGEAQEAAARLASALRYLMIAAVACFLVAYSAGRWAIAAVLSSDFAPASHSLTLLALALVPLALVRTGFLASNLDKRPGEAITGGAAGLATFLIVAAEFSTRDARGASLAVVAGATVAALTLLVRMSLVGLLARARVGRLLAAGGAAWALGAVTGPPALSAVASVGAYLALLRWSGGLGRGEVGRVMRAVLPGAGPG